MNRTPRKKPIDIALPVLNQAVDEWLASFDSEATKQEIFNRLNQKKEEIALKLLGFTNSWGAWEVDRDKASNINTVRSYLNTHLEGVIQEWLMKLPMPSLNTSRGRAILKAYERAYYEQLERVAYDLARERAKKDAKELLNAYFNSDDLEGFLKTRELLDLNTFEPRTP